MRCAARSASHSPPRTGRPTALPARPAATKACSIRQPQARMCCKAAWRAQASCAAKLVVEETRQASLRVRRPLTHKVTYKC